MGVYFSERCFLFFIIYTALDVHETARRGEWRMACDFAYILKHIGKNVWNIDRREIP